MYEYLKDRLDILSFKFDKLKDCEYKYNIDYHKAMLLDVERNLDTKITISFEGAQSLVVGLLKSMETYKSDNESKIKQKEEGRINALYNKCIKMYAPLESIRVINTHAHSANEDRNSHGDIAHGKDPLVFNQLPPSQQQFYIDFCLSTYKYCLNSFIEQIDIDIDNNISEYSVNSKFNNYLDEQEYEFNKFLREKKIKIRYSELLFNESIGVYTDALIEYNASDEDFEDLDYGDINNNIDYSLYIDSHSSSIDFNVLDILKKDIYSISKTYTINVDILSKDIIKSILKDRIELSDVAKEFTKNKELQLLDKLKKIKSIKSDLEKILTLKTKEKIIKLIEEAYKNKG
jgi:hypothetical protein